jgi:hypothetical protein
MWFVVQGLLLRGDLAAFFPLGCGKSCKIGASVNIGDAAGLRDLARMCLALSDDRAPDGAHIHLDEGINPLDLGSASLMLARSPRCSAQQP